MAAVLSPHTESVRAALVYQAVALSDQLKNALAGAGVNIVVEIVAGTIDRVALESAAPQVFVVNLDPDLEDHLDELTEVLDGFNRPVIFNDASASSGLSGWDQARWARHLGAKIKGEVDAHPPRPEGATFIPPLERKIVQIAAPRAAANAAEEKKAQPAAVYPPQPVKVAAPPVVKQVSTQTSSPILQPTAIPVLAPVKTASPTATGQIDVDALFADLLPAVPVVRPAQTPTIELPVVPSRASASVPTLELPKFEQHVQPVAESSEFGLGDDDSAFSFDLDAALPAATDAQAIDFGSLDAGGSSDLSELWSDADDEASTTAKDSPGFGHFDQFDPGFDAPLDGESLADFELPEPPQRMVEAELTDLDEMFRELAPKDAEVIVLAKPAASAPASERVAEAPRKVAELKAPPMDWSLEPLDGEGLAAEAPASTGRAQFKLGQEAASVLPPVPTPVASRAATPAVEESDTELAAFDFFFEPSGALPPPSDVTAVADKTRVPLDLADIPDFGLSLEALDTPEESSAVVPASKPAPIAAPVPVTRTPAAPVNAPAPAQELGAFDFNFDNFDEPSGPSKSASQRSMEAASLADLDGLFADIEAPPVISDIPNLDRVWILGASIGGPEAVRSFLTGLKKQVASAFILAQHMGSEFLDLMISQLAKASPLPVKVAQPGDKLQNGMVLVAPVGKRLTVDAQGRVQLGEMSSDMPYSPSIDQIMFDMADRFGPRCSAVIFSGMASDAIEGAKYIASKGGRIWVQDPSTCVISSMIDGAQAAGVVSYVGSPEQLSEHLQAHLS